jgi:hypothetical protein
LTHSNVPSSIAWVGIIRSILIAFPAYSPCQPCCSIISKKLPGMFLDPTPTTILVLHISQVTNQEGFHELLVKAVWNSYQQIKHFKNS